MFWTSTPEGGFELAYLTGLTSEGLKPLSRWEKDIRPDIRTQMERRGLLTRLVPRSVRSGKVVRELIFSRSAELLDQYMSRFAGAAIRPSPESVRLEGRWFGYPACCVESYVRRGYARNSLRKADQRILFHWACPDCQVTPTLLPRYRAVYRACRRAGQWGQTRHPGGGSRRGLTGALAAVAGLTLGHLAAPLAAQPSTLDPHQMRLELWEDTDQDFLKTWEEQVLGLNPALLDEDGNLTPDGIDLAYNLAVRIAELPVEVSASNPYVIHHMAFGLEDCQVCGERINMGFLELVNPRENQCVGMPYIGLHFLAHGSFSYGGSVHTGRANPPLLKTVLTSSGLAHFLADPPALDADQDGLRDWEEMAFQSQTNLPDADANQTLDGIDLARRLLGQVEALPRAPRPEEGPTDRVFVVEHPMDGVDTCPRCGEIITMGFLDVINPRTQTTVTFPSMARHYLAHGGFAWQGGRLAGGQGRVDPWQLQAVLSGLEDSHRLPPSPDADRDLLTDEEELALHTNPQAGDENGNQVPDGVELAKGLAAEVATLPAEPGPDRVWRRDHLFRGLEYCRCCGAAVNMGYLTLCNLRARLYAKLPYITLHYLEHGSFTYAGDVHGQGRFDVELLLDTLHSPGPAHLKPRAEDTDADGLDDLDEDYFQSDPHQPDTDADDVPDGYWLARELAGSVIELSRTPGPDGYAVDHLLRGLVTCDVCGTTVNMGYVELIHPRRGLTMSVPYLALHFMRHGSFAWSEADRVDARALARLLGPTVELTMTGGRARLHWTAKAGRAYTVHSAPSPTGPWSVETAVTGVGALLFEDPRPAEAQPRFYRIVEGKDSVLD